MIKYKNDYKYQLSEDYEVLIDFSDIVDEPIDTNFLTISDIGLHIKKGYAWDGATWYFDKSTIMRGSLVHDAMYQLIREGLIKMKERKRADKLLESCCKEDGMSSIEAKGVYWAVRAMGNTYVKPSSRREVLKAP